MFEKVNGSLKYDSNFFRSTPIYMCDPFWENVPKRADNVFPDLPIKA